MIFSSTSVIAEVYAGARSDATAHAAHAGASRFPRAAIGLTWQVRSLASRLGCRAGQARYGLDGVLAAIGLIRHPRRGPRGASLGGTFGDARVAPELLRELLPELMPVGSQRSLPARGFRDVTAMGPYA